MGGVDTVVRPGYRGNTVKLMEVCGTHTMVIAKQGIKKLLPPEIRMISGPGCPVCVTDTEDIDRVIEMTREDIYITTFGDLMKVPGSKSSLALEKAKGSKIKVVYSPIEAVELATEHTDKQVVFIGIGFETTAPAVALSIMSAKAKALKNYSVLCLHKTMPAAIRHLLAEGMQVDGFLLPGHVCTITGSKPFEFIADEYGIPGVISGFETGDIFQSIAMLLKNRKFPSVQIQYIRAVKTEGNIKAQKIMSQVFEPCDAKWRGLGLIKNSGLALKGEWQMFDAAKRWPVSGKSEAVENEISPLQKLCKCPEILRGTMEPNNCPLFGRSCTPERPVGPCMISSEGACAAYFKYGG